MDASPCPLAPLVADFLHQRQQALGGPLPLPSDLLVFDSGLLDSLALLELVAAVERHTGAELDMLRFDAGAVGTVAELVAQLRRSLIAAGAEATAAG